MTVIVSAGVGVSSGIIGSEILLLVWNSELMLKVLLFPFCYTETLDSPDAAIKIPPYQLR